jgi:hypothetical protein
VEGELLTLAEKRTNITITKRKRTERANNDLQNTTQKKYRLSNTNPHLKTGERAGAQQG